MRKVTEHAARAFKEMRPMSSGNTKVRIEQRTYGDSQKQVAVMYLHDNQIAIFDGKLLTLSDAGWQTNTTKERLNGILDVFNISGGISQRDYTWYFVAGHWTNTPTDTNPYDGHYTETRRESWDGMRKQWEV